MRKLLTLAAVVTVMAACAPKHNLEVSYKGLSNDTVFLSKCDLYEFITLRGMEEIDTLVIKNGKLKLNIDVQDEPQFFCIYSMDYRHSDGTHRWLRPSGEILNILYPGQPLKIEAVSADGYISTTVKTGNQINKDISAVKSEFRKYQHEYEDLMWGTHEEEYTPQQADAKKMELKELLSTTHSNFIEGHPASKASAFFLIYLKDMAEYANKLDDSIFEGEFAPIKDQLDDAVIIEKAKQVFAVEEDGMTLKMLDGEEVTKDKLAGKHTILYFWGTKQGGWMKGIPNLIETKGRYNEKFEAVIINCSNNKPELWQKELRAKGLNWNDLFAKHAGNHYPTKVILSPEGEVLGVYVNQSSSFNTTFEYELEQILK